MKTEFDSTPFGKIIIFLILFGPTAVAFKKFFVLFNLYDGVLLFVFVLIEGWLLYSLFRWSVDRINSKDK